MPTSSIVARNTAPASRNPIHTEEARAHGFRGGIVPGVTMVAYLMGEPIRRWGPAWIGDGEVDVRFRRPVYDGEEVTVTAEEREGSGGEVLDLRLEVPGRGACVEGHALRHRTLATPAAAWFPSGTAPEVLPPVSTEGLREAGALPPMPLDTSPSAVGDWLAEHGVDDRRFTDVLHPGMLSRASAVILPTRFTFDGPRIHRGLRSAFHAVRPVGTPLTARGRVTRVWDHNGHGYVSSELVIVDDGTDDVVVHLHSESIYRLRA